MVLDNHQEHGGPMGRKLAIAVAAASVALIVGYPAAAEASPANPICEKVLGGTICEQDPPGMHYEAVYLRGCTNFHHNIFGRSLNGENLVCAGGGPSGPVWNPAPTLFGEQLPGGACPSWLPGGAAAQTPDGLALVCQRGVGWTVNS
jgi:hypothetical protein